MQYLTVSKNKDRAGVEWNRVRITRVEWNTVGWVYVCCREILKIPDGISKSQCSLDEMVSKADRQTGKEEAKGGKKSNTGSKPLIKEGFEKCLLDIRRNLYTCFCSIMTQTWIKER